MGPPGASGAGGGRRVEPSVTWRGLKRYAAATCGRRSPTPSWPPTRRVRSGLGDIAALLCSVGVELLRAGGRTADVAGELRDIAARYGMQARSFVVPTGLFVRVGAGPQGVGGELDFAPVDGPDLRLDQVEALLGLTARMRAERVPFEEATRALRTLRDMPERFSPAAVFSGYALLTVGLGVILHATVPAARRGPRRVEGRRASGCR
ncbi:hypothetical protein ABH931_006553 [Streptacidiphilus sp. MAP12-33]